MVALSLPRTPHNPVRRSPAHALTCPATKSRPLPCQQQAQDHWPLFQSQPRSLSTGSQAGPQTRRVVLGETRHRSASASYPATPPSGMWEKFTSSSVHCQVRRHKLVQVHSWSMCTSRQETSLTFFLFCPYRLSGNRGGVSLSGDRWTGLAPAEGGPPDEHHEH